MTSRLPASVALLIVVAFATHTREARADDKQACSAAYDATQALRKDGKLLAAREQAAACIRDVCADFIRSDCAKWLGEIDSSQPTVVFEVKDVNGQDTSKVKVSLDGKPWLDGLDGKAKPIDPGHHALLVTIEGAPPIDQTVEAVEGDKNHLVKVTFQKRSPGAPPATTTSGDEPHDKPSAAPWIAGGAGVAGLVLFGVAGVVTLSEKSTTNKDCVDATMTCNAAGLSAAKTGSTMGALTTVGLAVGVVGIGTSIVLFATRPSAKSPASVGLGSWVGTQGGGMKLLGKF